MAKGIHLGDRRHLGSIPVVKIINALGQGRAGSRLNRQNPNIFTICLIRHKRESDPREVGTTTVTTDHHVGVVAGDLHLLLGLKTNHGLVHTDMVKHAPQRITGILMGGSIFNRLTDRDPQGARAVRIKLKDGTPGVGLVRWGRKDIGTPQLHHALAIRFLPVGDLDHVNGTFETEVLTGHGNGRTPLPGAGFRSNPFGTENLVVVGLRHRGIRLVRASRRDPFILVVDLRRCAECFLQFMGTVHRRWPPELINLEDLLRDINPSFLGYFLLDQSHGEQRQKVLRTYRLHRPRMNNRLHLTRHIRDDVVPLSGKLVFAEKDFTLHKSSPWS